MKRSLLNLFALTLLGVITMSYSNNPPPQGHTGSPGDGQSCARSTCHAGTPTTGEQIISTDIPADGYVPGTEYNITVEIVRAGVNKFGFQLTAEPETGSDFGSFTAGAGSTVSGAKYVSHGANQTSGSGSKSWAFKWTAPAASAGNITFYAAGNASNSSGNAIGDEIILSNLVAKEAGTSSVQSFSSDQGVKVYPNPARSNITIETGHSMDVRIINFAGEVISTLNSVSGASDVDLSDQPSGLYLISGQDKSGNSWEQKVLKY